ncbi:MAG: aldo/keto reductase family protein [Candidatus Krumholzibacteriia bacterium]
MTQAGATLVPDLVYGTAWKRDATTALTVQAVRAGFRGIDTANQPRHYDEPGVGAALRQLAAAGLGRDQLFLQTKFTSPGGQDHRIPYDPAAEPAAQVAASLASSLEHLGTDVLDAYLLHGPSARFGLEAYDLSVWAAIEEAHRAGTARLIGVSNVTLGQLALLCERAEIAPAIVQNRCYAAQGWDRDVRAFCRRHGIVYQGFSLLTANPQALASPQVAAAGQRLGLTAAQVVLRFAVQTGMTALTGTTDPGHMGQDLDAMGAELSADELAQIAAVAV